MKPTVGDIAAIMDAIAPLTWAESWDNAGLQTGDTAALAERILVALEITGPVVEEAIEKGAGLIITHHPMYLKPPARITDETGMGRLMLQMIRSGIAHYAAHTNLDKSSCGPDSTLCDILGLRDVEPLAMETGEGCYQLVTFCPVTHAEQVREALFAAGCGKIGAYSSCSFSTQGTGTFLPGEGTNPHIGSQGALSEVPEMRLEVVVPRHRAGSAVTALCAAHPYEEPVIDLYPIAVPVPETGIGRVGTLPALLTLDELAGTIKERLNAPVLMVCGEKDAQVKRLAVCAGAGADLIGQARRMGADAFLTGEIKHHELLDTSHEDFPVIAAGHYYTEAPAVEALAQRLRKELDRRGFSAKIDAAARMRAAYRGI